MAIDDAEKRKSISGISIPLMPGVTPNSGQDQEWRQEAGWIYSGILIGGAAGPAPLGTVPVRYIAEAPHVVPVETVGAAAIGVVNVREFVGPEHVVPVFEAPAQIGRTKVVKV